MCLTVQKQNLCAIHKTFFSLYWMAPTRWAVSVYSQFQFWLFISGKTELKRSQFLVTQSDQSEYEIWSNRVFTTTVTVTKTLAKKVQGFQRKEVRLGYRENKNHAPTPQPDLYRLQLTTTENPLPFLITACSFHSHSMCGWEIGLYVCVLVEKGV